MAKMAFLGGVSGIGKSHIAAQWARDLGWLRVQTFSDLMLRNLPKATNHHDILSATSHEERSQARRRAIESLACAEQPTLVTGHYAMCLFSSKKTLEAIEFAFPFELLPLIGGLILAHTDNLDLVLNRRGDKADELPHAGIKLECDIERAVFDYLAAASDVRKAIVPLDQKDADRLAVKFFHSIWPDVDRKA